MALKELLELERPTSKSILYTEWPSLPQINFECEEAKKFYEDLIIDN